MSLKKNNSKKKQLGPAGKAQIEQVTKLYKTTKGDRPFRDVEADFLANESNTVHAVSAIDNMAPTKTARRRLRRTLANANLPKASEKLGASIKSVPELHEWYRRNVDKSVSYTHFLELLQLDGFWGSLWGVLKKVGQSVLPSLFSSLSGQIREKVPEDFRSIYDVGSNYVGGLINKVREPRVDPPGDGMMMMGNPFSGMGDSFNENPVGFSGYRDPETGGDIPINGARYDAYSINSVNKEALCTLIQNKNYNARVPDAYWTDGPAITRYTETFNLVTDSQGNVGFWFTPQSYNAKGPLSATPNLPFWHAIMTADLTATPFVPSTGIYTTTITNPYPAPVTGGVYQFGSPLFSTQAVADAYVTGCTLDIYPEVSDLNNQGIIEVFQLKSSSAGVGPGPFMPQTILSDQSYYQRTSVKGEFNRRHVWLPSNVTSSTYNEWSSNIATGTWGAITSGILNPVTDAFYVLVTGAIPNAVVATIETITTLQYHPQQQFSSLIDQQTAGPGPRTRDLMVMLTQMFPFIENFSDKQASELCQKIMQCPSVNADAIIRCIAGGVGKHATLGGVL